jgi:PIN domain nuclease of toxin-antitoxin system
LKGYLLDTNVALLAVTIPERLSAKIRKAIEEGPTFLSVIAYWEVMIKSMKGTLDIGDPRRWWEETINALAMQPLLYRPEHIAAIYSLPSVHQDPFDRGLIAQAIVEDLTLLTTDDTIPKYASRDFKVIR